tara:strand:+ start:140 stop:586 length:447 start_codon:yes stop_codon:yes gene_type:complete
MKKTRLKSKEINKILSIYDLALTKKDQVELLEGEFKIIAINQVPAFFYYQEQWVPTLKFLQTNLLLKKITVDMGAVKFVVNGADIMRPGIVEIELEIKKNDFIVIIDQNNKKSLAVGIALLNSEEMQNSSSGKVIKNIHYVGDELWKM